MRKKILLIAILLMPFIVKANSVSVDCPEKIRAGETGNCTITGTTDTEITAISATINLSDNLSIVSFALDDLWQGSDIDDGKMDIFTNSGDVITGNFTIGVLTVEAADDAYDNSESVGLTSVSFSDDNGDYDVSSASDNVRIPSNDNTLKELSIDGVPLSPNFDPAVTKYTGSTTNSAVNVVAVANHKSATVTEMGVIDLVDGSNDISITVTAEDGSKKVYKITLTADIYKPDEPTPTPTPSDKTDEELDSNVTTGSSIIYVIVAIGIIAIAGMTFYYKKLINKK